MIHAYHVNNLEWFSILLELVIHVLQHLLESAALPVPICRKQDTNVLSVEGREWYLAVITLQEVASKHVLDVAMSLLSPWKLIGKRVSIMVLNDVCDSRSDVTVDGLPFRVQEDQHWDLAHLESSGQLLVGCLAMIRDSKPRHHGHKLFERGLILCRAAGHSRWNVNNLEGLLLLFCQFLVHLHERLHELFARARPCRSKKDSDVLDVLQTALGTNFANSILVESLSEKSLNKPIRTSVHIVREMGTLKSVGGTLPSLILRIGTVETEVQR